MKRRPHRTERAHARETRARVGTTAAGLDWQCPHCKKWCSDRHGGPKKHLDRCPVLASQAAARAAQDSPPAELDIDQILQHFTSQESSEQLGAVLENIDPPSVDTQDEVAGFDAFPNSPHPRTPQTPLDNTYIHPGAPGEIHHDDSDPRDAFDPYIYPLQPGETLVVPHPHAGTAPYVIPTVKLAEAATLNDSDNEDTSDRSRPPWFPFRTLEDFEQAELFILGNDPDPKINKQLRILHKVSSTDQISFRNARELHALIEEAAIGEDLDGFEMKTLKVPYRTNQMREYTLRYRKALPAILRIMEDETLLGKLHTYPEKRYVRRSNGNGNMRVYCEVNSGDDWHDVQTAVGAENFVINVCLYSDATQLNAFGTQKAWGVYLWVTNVPKALRKGRGKGRAILVAYLPKVQGNNHDDASHLATHRAQVFHEAMRCIFESMEFAAEFGTYVSCKDKDTFIDRIGIILVGILAMDFEEKVRAAALLGAHSGFPCPICLVPHAEQWNFRKDWALRTQQGAQTLLDEAAQKTTQAARKETLALQSLRPLLNAFFPLCGKYFDTYQTFCTDPLHEVEQGIHGKHIWPWLLDKILDSDMKDHLDQHYKSLPSFPRVHHFSNGITSLKYITAREHNTILRYLAPLITGLRPDLDHLLLPLLRHLSCALLLMRFETHTDDTLAILEDKIQLFGEAAERVRNADLGISFNFPKFHMVMKHAVDSIRRKGSVDNSATDLGEGLHPQTKVDWHRTNHQDTAETQMLRMTRERDVIMHIRDRVDRAEDVTAFKSTAEDSFPSDSQAPGPPPHIKLGSPRRALHVYSYALQLGTEGHQVPQFGDRLLQFLRCQLGQNFLVHDIQSCKVIPHRALRITYICQVSATYNEDIIHVSPDWRMRGPRQDELMVQGARPSKPMFAEICAMFSLSLGGTNYSIGLVKFYRNLGRHHLSMYVELDKHTEYDFIFLDTAIRSVHIIPPNLFRPRSTVQDLVDGDMYLRLIAMK